MDLDNFLEQERRNREIRQQARQKPTRVKPAAPIRRGPSASTSRPTQRPPIQEFRPEPRSRTKPAATAKPAIKQNTKQYSQAVTPSSSRKPGAIKRDIDKALVPYIDRDRSEPRLGRFSELTEQDFVNESQQTHDTIRRMRGMSYEDRAREVSKGTGLRIGTDDKAILEFIKRADYDRFGNLNSAEMRMAVPHTAGRENLMRTLMNNSGRETEFLNSADVHATDLRSSFSNPNDTLIDVQDMFPKEKLSVGALKNLDTEKALQEWIRSGDNESILDISRRMSDRARRNGNPIGLDKLFQGRGEILEDFPKDLHMRTRADEFGKDFLIGGKYTPPNTNAIGSPNQGAFDPQMFSRGYALDLDQTREIILPMKKGDLSQLDITPNIQDGAFKLQIPASRFKDVGGGEAVRNHVFSPEVQRVLKQDFGADFYAGLGSPEDANKLIKGAVKGWRGGLGASALNGASGEAAKKLVQGDVAGAVGEFGKTYAIGAAADRGLSAAAKSKTARFAGQKILSTLAKRAPGIAARFGARTAASGGLLAPVAAVATGVEVFDGVMEGATGKGIAAWAQEPAVISTENRRENRGSQYKPPVAPTPSTEEAEIPAVDKPESRWSRRVRNRRSSR